MFFRKDARALLAFIFACAFLLLGGCANYPQSQSLLHETPANLPESARIESVPFIAQEDYFCGPSSLSMLLQHQGLNPELERLVALVYVPEKQGSFQLELKAATRRFDLVPYELKPSLKDVLSEVAAGNPVLVLQNLGLESVPTWHYAIVVGYDLREKQVILHSGLEAFSSMLITTFERTWLNQSNGWAMVALKPNRIPESASAFRYQKALEELIEVNRSEIAKQGYETALEHWPDNSALAFGYGNLLYAIGDVYRSSLAFAKAVQRNPDEARAWNNLAYTLAEQGCSSALSAIDCATTLDPQNDYFAVTADEVKGMLAQPSGNTQTCIDFPACPIRQSQ